MFVLSLDTSRRCWVANSRHSARIHSNELCILIKNITNRPKIVWCSSHYLTSSLSVQAGKGLTVCKAYGSEKVMIHCSKHLLTLTHKIWFYNLVQNILKIIPNASIKMGSSVICTRALTWKQMFGHSTYNSTKNKDWVNIVDFSKWL